MTREREGSLSDIERNHAELIRRLVPSKQNLDLRARLVKAVALGRRIDFEEPVNIVPDRVLPEIAPRLEQARDAVSKIPIAEIGKELEHLESAVTKLLDARPMARTIIETATPEVIAKPGQPDAITWANRVRTLTSKYPTAEAFITKASEALSRGLQGRPEEEVRTQLQLHAYYLSTIIDAVYSTQGAYWLELKKIEQELSEQQKAVQREQRANAAELAPQLRWVKIINTAEQSQITKRIAVHGDEYQGKRLTAEYLSLNGLGPTYQIEADGESRFYVSEPYDLGDLRTAVMVYVDDGSKVTARSYYLSNSSGLWRYLPAYSNNLRGQAAHYNKGLGEESIAAPAVFQRALAEITSKQAPKQIDNADFVFVGTARKKENMEIGTYLQQVDLFPMEIPGVFKNENQFSKAKLPPERIQFYDKNWKPNFTAPDMTWTQKSKLYGDFTVEAFASHNGKCLYLFCKDKKGRAWIGGIEALSEIGATGLRNKWIDAGDLATPADEYGEQSGGYGNYNKVNGDHYVDMFDHYLSRIGVIQEYLNRKSTPNPHGMHTIEMRTERSIEHANSFEELFETLRRMDALPGASSPYSGAEWVKIINRIRTEGENIGNVTRACGLRDTVFRLLQMENARTTLR